MTVTSMYQDFGVWVNGFCLLDDVLCLMYITVGTLHIPCRFIPYHRISDAKRFLNEEAKSRIVGVGAATRIGKAPL